MTLPDPEPGLVIGYSYLWASEAGAGREEGHKDRPCAIVLVVTHTGGGKVVRVLPITHSPPADPTEAVEIPAPVKLRLGLDSLRSWIIISEANDFTWPGPDLRPIRIRETNSVKIGLLPPRFFDQVRKKYIERAISRRAVRVPRTE